MLQDEGLWNFVVSETRMEDLCHFILGGPNVEAELFHITRMSLRTAFQSEVG
jgi:hypothetical protein